MASRVKSLSEIACFGIVSVVLASALRIAILHSTVRLEEENAGVALCASVPVSTVKINPSRKDRGKEKELTDGQLNRWDFDVRVKGTQLLVL